MSNQQESSDDVAVNVLIVGAGPAGYMAGVTLARYGSGHAGGVQSRTQEIFQTLDLRYDFDSKGNHVSEAAFWSPNAQAKLERTHVGPEVVHATPYPWILAIPQRETEQAFDLDFHTKGQYVDRPTQLLGLNYTVDLHLYKL
ncbi:MAG: hypothetical protein ASARMPREDX12_000304 [Alectoria sarmentosa]|nr:MAG: hypothetical protein ASARMPREDX12_000304 [Alectoria sarmentosa]